MNENEIKELLRKRFDEWTHWIKCRLNEKYPMQVDYMIDKADEDNAIFEELFGTQFDVERQKAMGEIRDQVKKIKKEADKKRCHCGGKGKVKIYNDELEYLGKRVVHYEKHSEIPYVKIDEEIIAVEEAYTEREGNYAVLETFIYMGD